MAESKHNMGSEVTHEHASTSDPDPAVGTVGHEILDPHIRDDRGDPHRAALEDVNPEAKVSASTWAAIFFMGFTFHASLSFTILTVFPILVPIALELQGSTLNVNWMASGWSLSGSVAFAIAGQLSDYFGRRDVLMFGQVLLVVGHIIGATAKSVNQGIAAMAILGFGTGTTFVIYPGISELLPNKYRSIGLASTELQLLLFSMFGPLIARSLLVHATWRWVFYLGIISGVIAFIGCAIFYTPPSRPFQDRTKRQVLKELDYVGIFLYTSGVTLFLLALGWGGISHPWASAAVLVPLLLGIVLFGCCFVWDFGGWAKRPLFPYRLFKMFREYTSLLIIIFVTGLVYISITDLIPEEIGYVFTSDATKAGYYNIPAGFGGSIGGTVLGGLIYRIKHVPLQLMVGVAVQTIFTALQALITPDRIAMGIVFQGLANIPFGWILINCYITAGLHVPQRDIGLAFGLIGSIRFLGGAVGVAVFSTVLANRAAPAIPARVVAAVAPLNYPIGKIPSLVAAVSSGVTSELAGIPPHVIQAAGEAIRWAYSDAFRITWLVSIPFGVVAFVVACFVRDPSPYFTKHTAVTLEKERLGRHKAQGSEVNHKEIGNPSTEKNM